MSINDNTLLSELRYKDLTDALAAGNREMSTKLDLLIQENALLKLELKDLKIERDRDHRKLINLENHMKRKSLIFRNLPSEDICENAVKAVCDTKLKVHVDLKAARKLYDRNGRMGVIVEMDSERMVDTVLKSTRNLAGTAISIERDINSDRQEDKKVLLQLKKDILETDKRHAVRVRDDSMRINNKWLKWNPQKQLVCGSQNGTEAITELYGNTFDNFNFSYADIIKKIVNRNLS